MIILFGHKLLDRVKRFSSRDARTHELFLKMTSISLFICLTVCPSVHVICGRLAWWLGGWVAGWLGVCMSGWVAGWRLCVLACLCLSALPRHVILLDLIRTVNKLMPQPFEYKLQA